MLVARKLDPNQLCWCNSGQKFKKCHRDREHQPEVTVQRLLEKHNEAFAQELCLHPQASNTTCKGNIIRAHTIQRSGGLSQIARDGHVYTNRPPNVAAFMAKQEGKLVPRLQGIKVASTFTGFCAHHDSETFKPIEARKFEGTPEQCLLLAFRALCRELFAKVGQHRHLKTIRSMDAGKPIEVQQAIQNMLLGFIAGVNASIQDMRDLKHCYDKALLASDYSNLHFYVLYIDQVPEFMCSGAVHPTIDFASSRLQTLRPGTAVENVTFSLIARELEGAIVFAWLGKSDVATALIKSLDAVPDDAKPAAIARFTYSFFENVYASPAWWEGLAETERAALVERAHSGSPRKPHMSDELKDDGLRPVSWKISGKVTNVPGL